MRDQAALKRLLDMSAEHAEANQKLLTRALEKTRAIDVGSDIIYHENFGNALRILGRIRHPTEKTLNELTTRLRGRVGRMDARDWEWNYGILTALGRMGPAAKNALPRIAVLPGIQHGAAEAIQRISGEPPQGYFLDKAPNARGRIPRAKVPGFRAWSGEMSGIEDEEVHLIRDSGSWSQLWSRHARATNPPHVDFSRFSILAYFHGGARTAMGPTLAAYDDIHKSITAKLQVGYSDCISGVSSFPFLIIEIPRTPKALVVVKSSYQAMSRDSIPDKVLARFQ